MTRDYEREVENAMSECPSCQRLDPQRWQAHHKRALAEILQTQSQPPRRLPAHVWPNGRTPR